MVRLVSDPRVWNSIRWLYMGAGVLFLANITLGIVNVFTPGALPRGQLLSHFHAGTIGWITLSIIATMLWVFTAGRQVAANVAAFITGLTVVSILAVAGYIAAFGLVFNGDGPFWLLPLFGVPSWLVILAATIFAGTQFKHQAVVTTVHLLFFGALLVASLGATMGVLQGLSYVRGSYPGPPGADGLGAHAGPMEMYLGLAFAGLAELLVGRNWEQRWTKAGMTQMVLSVVGGYLGSIALYANIGPLIPLGLLLYLVSFGIYFARIGWRTFTVNPFKPGRAAAIFWGGLAYPFNIILFVILVALFFVPGNPLPHDLGVIFAHVSFIGAGTNFILATQSVYGDRGAPVHKWQGPAHWLLNLGMLVFFAGEVMAERREGALVMAVGVLAALFIVWSRLGASWQPPGMDTVSVLSPPPPPPMR